MSFYLVTNGIVHPHQFNYLVDEDGKKKSRIEKTLPHGNSYHQKKIEYPKGAHHFVIEKMTKYIQTVEENFSLDRAMDVLLKHNFHHLPVIKNEKIIGLLSDRDLLKLKGDTLFNLISVKDVMGTIVLCCDEETELLEVAQVFVKEMISAIPVIDKTGKVLGIITKVDLLSALVTHEFFD
jgi:CBS domain-containing protein